MSSATDSQNNSNMTIINSDADSAESIYCDPKPYYNWSDTESDDEDDPVEWNTCQICEADAPSRHLFCCKLCFACYHPVCISPGCWVRYNDPRYISWTCPSCTSPKPVIKKRKRDEFEDDDSSSSE